MYLKRVFNKRFVIVESQSDKWQFKSSESETKVSESYLLKNNLLTTFK